MKTNPTWTKSNTNVPMIALDLSWVDMLKGIAIIGVIFDNWTGFMEFADTPVLLHAMAKTFSVLVGPFVHVFFILSGFGLATAYFRGKNANWSWTRWAWRRITKVVIPYIVFVAFTFSMGILGSYLYASIDLKFSWASFFAHLTFTRNFYPPSWIWNWSSGSVKGARRLW